jgi:hypothetical protein
MDSWIVFDIMDTAILQFFWVYSSNVDHVFVDSIYPKYKTRGTKRKHQGCF